MKHILDASARLERAKAQQDAIVVSFSGGKDALATMDLVMRTGFKRVEAFFMEAVPGLDASQRVEDECKSRFGIVPRRYPHWTMLQALGDGIYCHPDWPEGLSKIKLKDIHDAVRRDTGILNIATGYKKADSIWRRRMMAKPKAMKNVVCPLAEWNQSYVYSYLKARGIPPPRVLHTSGGEHNADGSVGLKETELLDLWDNNRPDFERLRRVFPFIDACPKRREFYGNIDSLDRRRGKEKASAPKEASA